MNQFVKELLVLIAFIFSLKRNYTNGLSYLKVKRTTEPQSHREIFFPALEGEGMEEMRSVEGEGMEGMRSVEGDAMEETLCLRVSVVILPTGYRKP